MNPCYSGFQVQGTATTPAGMTPPDAPIKIVLISTANFTRKSVGLCFNDIYKTFHSLMNYIIYF